MSCQFHLENKQETYLTYRKIHTQLYPSLECKRTGHVGTVGCLETYQQLSWSDLLVAAPGTPVIGLQLWTVQVDLVMVTYTQGAVICIFLVCGFCNDQKLQSSLMLFLACQSSTNIMAVILSGQTVDTLIPGIWHVAKVRILSSALHKQFPLPGKGHSFLLFSRVLQGYRASIEVELLYAFSHSSQR